MDRLSLNTYIMALLTLTCVIMPVVSDNPDPTVNIVKNIVTPAIVPDYLESPQIPNFIVRDSSENTENMDIDPDAVVKIKITSSAFAAGGRIPTQYTCSGSDISPPLKWSNVPAGTKSFALIVEDPDAPSGIFTHWIIYNIPATKKTMAKNIQKISKLADGSRQGVNDFGRIGYSGPCPPSGQVHRYFFKIYALDKKLSLTGQVKRATLINAMNGHILRNGQLLGKFSQ